MRNSSHSRRLLVFHGSSPHQSRLQKTRLSTIEKHSEATTSCLNLEQLNDTRLMTRNSQTEQTEAEMRAQLAAKEDMIEFYLREQARRKQRYNQDISNREKTLTETLNNLKSLLQIEQEKNEKIANKIEEIRNAPNNPQQSSLLGYSDYEISKSMLKKDETILLDEMSSSLTLTQYL